MSDLSSYGHFLPADGCFELTGTPPRKWWNLHCNRIGDDEIYAEVCNIGDGRTILRDRDGVTVNLVGWDCKYAYIRDDDRLATFCPGGSPAPDPVADRTCRYYRHMTVLRATAHGLHAAQRAFVPLDLPVEAHTITVDNLEDRPRRISVFFVAKFDLSGGDREGRYVGSEKYAEVLPEIGGVFVVNRNGAAPTERFKGYLIALEQFRNGNGYRDHFTREEFAVGTPRLLWGWNCDGRPGYGPDCWATVQVSFELLPHGRGRADFIIGQAADIAEIKALRQRVTPADLDRFCWEAGVEEQGRADAFLVDVGDDHYNGLFNIFIKKQLYCYLINKSGFRDNLQVDVPLAMCAYPAAEQNLLRALASQYPSGSVPHGFRPLNRLQYSDKPAWILMTLPALLKESGDCGLLEKVVPYFESDERGTVWDHALRAMRFLAQDTGRHGLCDQHHADWNDGLEATKEAGARESVMVTQQLCFGLREMADVARHIGDQVVADEADALYAHFAKLLNDVAWDGEWYARTLCGDGYRIGSHACAEGSIFLNTQSWAVISGIAPRDRAELCMGKVDALLETDLGFRICHPPYSKYDARVGRMSSNMPGANENGGCYNHAAGFKGVADCLLGRAEEAWRTFVKVTPNSPENPLARSGAEPFSYVNSYSSVPYIYGQSGYAWRTGTSGWMTTLLIEYILGARRDWDGLRLAPCLPASLPRAYVKRTFRGAVFHIAIDNAAGRRTGVRSLTLNGKPVAGDLLPDLRDGEHRVEVVV